MTNPTIHIPERQSIINEVAAALFTGAILIVAGALSFGLFASLAV